MCKKHGSVSPAGNRQPIACQQCAMIGWQAVTPTPLLQMIGHREKNSKQETDQTVITITKALSKFCV